MCLTTEKICYETAVACKCRRKEERGMEKREWGGGLGGGQEGEDQHFPHLTRCN